MNMKRAIMGQLKSYYITKAVLILVYIIAYNCDPISNDTSAHHTTSSSGIIVQTSRASRNTSTGDVGSNTDAGSDSRFANTTDPHTTLSYDRLANTTRIASTPTPPRISNVHWSFCQTLPTSNTPYGYAAGGVTLRCRMSQRGSLMRYERLRDYLAARAGTNVTLDVDCGHVGVLELPWTLELANLRVVLIARCNVTRFYEAYEWWERRHQQVLADTGRLPWVEPMNDGREVIRISDSRLLATAHSTILSIKHFTSVVSCGPLGARIVAHHNVTYDQYGDSSHLSNKEIESIFERYYLERARVDRRCSYRNLELMDWSGTKWYRNRDFQTFTDTSATPALRILNLSYTGIDAIPDTLSATLRPNFPLLTTIDLTGTNISAIRFPPKPSAATSAPRVSYLLQSAAIETLDSDTLDQLITRDDVIVDLHGNRFRCTCAQWPTVQRVQATLNDKPTCNATCSGSSATRLRQLRCASPQSLAGAALHAIESRDMLCPSWTTLIVALCVAFLSLCVALLVSGVFAYRHRVKLRHVARKYAARARCCCVAAPQPDDTAADVFVCYAHAQAERAVRLVRALESRGVRARFDDRDFCGGDFISRSIVDALHASRRCLLLVTAEFTDSAWCLMEFRAARHFHEQRRSAHVAHSYVVAVLYDGVDLSGVDPELRAFLQVNGYMRSDDPKLEEILSKTLLSQ